MVFQIKEVLIWLLHMFLIKKFVLIQKMIILSKIRDL